MLKEDFNEIRKSLKPKQANIQEVYAAYANSEKNVLFSSKKGWFSMTDDEKEIYSFIFSKVLSGKTSVNLHFLDVERSEQQESFLQFGRLHDAKAIELLVQQIIDEYNSKESFAVLVATCSYSVPSIAADGFRLEDSFDENYRFITCAICPTKLEKPSIIYKHDAKFFESAKRDYVLQAPNAGFLYPTFENRSSNVNKILFYSKNIKKLPIEVIDRIFGLELNTTVDQDCDIYSNLIQSSFSNSNNLSVDTLHKINLSMEEELEASLSNDSDGVITVKELNNILVKHGGESVSVKDGPVQLASLVTHKYCLQRDSNIKIVADEDAVNDIRQEFVNGVPSLVIPLSGFTFNDIPLD